MFAASCIGVFFLGVLLEALRRLAKEYETYALRQLRSLDVKGMRKATPLQQLIRAVLHAAVFAVAYILMLLAMYFNGSVGLLPFLGLN
jgi:copper transporter 1